MKRVRFRKMEGAGNDYVFVDGIREALPLDRAPELAQRWSDRHFGIGADGLIVLLRGAGAPVRMAMWNADGSRGAMCGNGLRCLARLARDHGHVATDAFPVATDAGLRAVELLGPDRVRTDLGTVRCGSPTRIDLAGAALEYVPGDAGNPHAVVFVAAVDRCDVAGLGRALQARRDLFPDSVNVEFVEVLAPDLICQRTYERGSGETLACGTGAAVAALAARQTGRCSGHTIDVQLRGGRLRALLGRSSLAIEGPVRTVFTGEILLPE
ncbi:MAG: diaminopimelate epimerase [Planctomycetes bacterium]|nr:diaminopimelate epimerase [Planctomycetota bacterium]